MLEVIEIAQEKKDNHMIIPWRAVNGAGVLPLQLTSSLGLTQRRG